MRTCGVAACGEKHSAMSLCNKHYQQWRDGKDVGPIAREGEPHLCSTADPTYVCIDCGDAFLAWLKAISTPKSAAKAAA